MEGEYILQIKWEIKNKQAVKSLAIYFVLKPQVLIPFGFPELVSLQH